MLALMDKDWHQKGLQLKQKGQYQKAIQAFDQAIDHKIKLAEAYYERALCFYKLGNSRQAANDLAAAALLGCRAAEFWSKYDRKKFLKSDEDNEA
jgi:tetratricopeptide (TPR) repeat protein